MKTKLPYIYAFGFFCLGISIGVLFCNWTFFEIEKKISLDSLIELLITSIIGIYIAKTIQNQHSVSRNEKDFFISEIKGVKKYLDELSHFEDLNTFPFETTKTTFKELNQNILLLDSLIKESNSCKTIDISIISNYVRSLRRYVTSKSPNSSGNIILATSEKRYVESEILKMKKELFRFILQINS